MIAIPVASQYVRSIRSRSFEAETGSHGITTAMAVVAAAMTTASSARWTNDLLRTGGSQRTRTVWLTPSPQTCVQRRAARADTRVMIDQPLNQRLREIREGLHAAAQEPV